MRHVQGRGELHTGFWLEDLRKREHLVDLSTDRTIIFKIKY